MTVSDLIRMLADYGPDEDVQIHMYDPDGLGDPMIGNDVRVCHEEPGLVILETIEVVE